MEDNDIKIDNPYENFKFRVNGILIHDNKILLVKIHKNTFYCLPGGHVKLGEDTESAIMREFKEETGYTVRINKLIAITENFFTRKTKKRIHELGFYYLLDIEDNEKINYKESETMEDDMKMYFKWISVKEIKNIEFKPVELREKIEKKSINFEHIIIKS